MGDTNPNIQRVSFERNTRVQRLKLVENVPGTDEMGTEVLQNMTLDHRLLVLLIRQELTEVTKTFLCSMATLQL
jgi:hypothetical protein